MRKLTKKALSLVLCVMLVVSAFSCAFGVFAEEVGSTVVNGMTVYDAPVELDFSGSLETWINNTTDGGTQRFVAENGVLKAGSDITTYGGFANPVSSAYFKIPGITAGAGIQFSLDLAVDPAMVSGHPNYNYELLRIQYKQFNADGSVKSAPAYASYTAVQYVAGTKTSPVFTIDDPDEFFQITISSPKNPGFAWSLSNFHMDKKDEEYEFDFVDLGAPSYYGTADDGFNSNLSSSYPVYLKPAEAIANLDFQAGFVYWSGKNSAPGTIASDSLKLVLDGDNIYVAVKNAGYVDNIQTTFFDLSSKLSPGDTVALIYDAKGADATKLRPYLKQDGIRDVEYSEETGLSTTLKEGSTSLLAPSTGNIGGDLITNTATQTEFAVQTEVEGWTTYITTTAAILDPVVAVGNTSVPVTDGIFLQIKVGGASGVTAGTTLDAAIDNIRIAKVANGVYTDLATDEVIFDASSVPPSYYGTEKDGFSSIGASWPMGLKPVEGTKNLDFEQGFIYWSGEQYQSPANTNLLASNTFKLVNDGTNKYVTLKDEGYVSTMRSALFRVEDVNVGDKLVLVYDAKGTDAEKIRVTLNQEHIRTEEHVNYDPISGLNTTGKDASPGRPNTLVNSSATLTTITIDGTAEGWTTYMTGFSAAVNDPVNVPDPGKNPCREDIYLQIIFEKAAGVTAGDQLDVAIDNIRVAKIVDGVCVDINTSEVLYDPSDAPVTYYGTAEDGFNSKLTSSYPLNLKPVETIKNLDFSEGFIYWSGRNASEGAGTLASDSFDLITDGENKYIAVKETGYVDTMCSALFKAEGVNPGDKLVLIYDAKGADANKLRVTLLQQHLRGEDNGVTYDEVTGLYDGSAGPATPGTPTHLVNNKAARAELGADAIAGEGWTTYVTDCSAVVTDPTTLGGERVCIEDIFLQVIVDKSGAVSAGEQLDASIDNIRIAKITGDDMYVDVATGLEIGYKVEFEAPDVDATTLANLVTLILNDQFDINYDYNEDGNVDILDIVALKKKLVDIDLNGVQK